VAWMKPAILFALALMLMGLLLVSCGSDPDDIEDDHSHDDSGDDDDSTSNDDDDNDDAVQPYDAPDQWGPYQVGVTTMYLVDETRHENWGDHDRTLPLEVWYPSTGQGGRISTIPDMIGILPQWIMNLLVAVYGDYFDEIWSTTTAARRDSELLIEDGPYPVIAFSHGYMGVRFQNVTMCEHLASHGFVVVSPDHYGNAMFTLMPEGALAIFNPISTVTTLRDRPLDIALIYDSLQEMNKEEQGVWNGFLDLERFAVSGHSYGGLTSLESGARFDFVDAIAPLNPAWLGPFPMEFSKPMLLLQGEMDMLIGGMGMNDKTQEIFAGIASDRKMFINLFRGGHYSATDACLLVPPSIGIIVEGCKPPRIDSDTANFLTCGYMTAFFKSVLLGDERYDDYLLKNHFEDEMDLTTVWN
jgi:dienelactone hydrolase